MRDKLSGYRALLLCFLACLTMLGSAQTCFANQAGPTSPLSETNVVLSGNTWTNLGNAFNSDDAYTSVILIGANSDYLKATNFGFSIPAGSTILGVTVYIERRQDTGVSGNIRDNSIKLVKGGSIVGSNKASIST